MTQVRFATLGDVCAFTGGGTPSRKQPDYFAGEIPWATVKDFKHFTIEDTKEHITEQAVRDSAANIIDRGSVLLVTRVGLGKVAIAGTRLAINQDIKAVQPNADLDPEFLFWFLLSQAERIQSMGTGATVKGVTLNDIKRIRCPIPSHTEQRRIVDLLSRAERIVRLRRGAQRKAAELIPAIFLDLFGDPAGNPKRWPTRYLPEVLAAPFKNGLYVKKECYALEGSHEGVEMVHMSDAFYGVVKRGRLKRVLINALQLEQYRLTERDLLIARRSLNYEGAAKPCRVPSSDEPLVFESSFIRLTPEPSKVLVPFLLAYLDDASTREAHVRPYITGINIYGVNQDGLSRIPVMLPPIDLQHQFAAKAEAARSIVAQQTAALATARAAFDALLHRAFAS